MKKSRIFVFILALMLASPSFVSAEDGEDRIISSVAPSSAAAGALVLLTGNNLDVSVQISNSLGEITTVTGTINSEKTEVSFRIPVELPRGSYKVRVGPNAIDVSSEASLTITSGSGPTIISISPAQAKPEESVLVRGTNLTGQIQLQLGGNTRDAVGTVNFNATETTFNVPLDTQPGEYTVVVISPDGNATSPTTLKVVTGGAPFVPNPNPTVPSEGLPTDLGQLVQQIFTWSLGLLGVAVFVMFFYAGILYLTAAGNTAKTSEARSKMTNAVFGAILLLSSYLILNTINPNFVRNTFDLPGIDSQSGGNQPPPGETPPPGATCPTPTTPATLCENVDRDTVLSILNKFQPSNEGITAAIIEVQTIYPDAKVIPHARLDKIDFGGGLVVDVIQGAVAVGVGEGWVWNIDCPCGGSN